MELLGFILELILGILDLCCFGADIYSFFKGRPNRVERRTAKKAGATPPPRDKWNRRVIVLTLSICVLTILFFIVRARLW